MERSMGNRVGGTKLRKWNQESEPTEPGPETWTRRDVCGQTSLEGHAWAEPIPSPAPSTRAPVPAARAGPQRGGCAHPKGASQTFPWLGKALVHLPQGEGWVGP